MPWLHASSVAVFFAQLCGYVALSTALQRRFYHARAAEAVAWRAQPHAPPHAPDDGTGRQWRWGLPALELFGRGAKASAPPGGPAQLRRHPRHARFATLNLLLSAAFAGAVAEATSRGAGALTWRADAARPGPLLAQLIACLIQQSVLEYYWHWAMHTPVLYRHLHCHHHYYKAPQPWDDLCIHPLEAFGYFCILYSPAAVSILPVRLAGRCHVAAFVAYMAVCGVCGVLDHSGVRVRLALPLPVPWRGAPADVPIYDSEEHDAHHSCGFGGATALNLGFPFALLDRLHGTYIAPADARRRLDKLRGAAAAAHAAPRRSPRTAR